MKIQPHQVIVCCLPQWEQVLVQARRVQVNCLTNGRDVALTCAVGNAATRRLPSAHWSSHGGSPTSPQVPASHNRPKSS